MSEGLAIAPAAPAAEPTITELAALVPDSALVGDPSVAAGPAPAPAENKADLADAARLADRNEPAPVDAPAEEPPPAETAETAAPPEPTVDNEALERAEQAAKRAREGSRRYRDMLAQQDRVRQEAQRAAAEAAQARKEAEEARKVQEAWKKDPYNTLKKLGMTDQELAERALREGTPEALIHQLNERLEQEAQARAALEQRLADERAFMARQQAEQKFYSVADNETAYPRLSQLNATAQLAVAQAALQQIANNGYATSGLSDEQVAEACERFLTPKRGAKAASKPAPAAAPAAKPAPAPAKTLTNAVSTQRAAAPREWHEMSDDEQIAFIASQIPDPA